MTQARRSLTDGFQYRTFIKIVSFFNNDIRFFGSLHNAFHFGHDSTPTPIKESIEKAIPNRFSVAATCCSIKGSHARNCFTRYRTIANNFLDRINKCLFRLFLNRLQFRRFISLFIRFTAPRPQHRCGHQCKFAKIFAKEVGHSLNVQNSGWR